MGFLSQQNLLFCKPLFLTILALIPVFLKLKYRSKYRLQQQRQANSQPFTRVWFCLSVPARLNASTMNAEFNTGEK
jgi:hypothetical protein